MKYKFALIIYLGIVALTGFSYADPAERDPSSLINPVNSTQDQTTDGENDSSPEELDDVMIA